MEQRICFTRLRTCGLDTAIGVDAAPAFSWVPEVNAASSNQGKGQSAYQIILTEKDYLVWDSGKVISQDLQGAYSGPALKSSCSYRWKVRIWDEGDAVSNWSEEVRFMTGVVRPADWKASWLDAGQSPDSRIAPIFRKHFCVAQGLETAVLHICGLGLYTLKINGQDADDTLLNPANTQFDVRALYRTYCVEKQLSPGENTVTVELGNGFYNECSGVWDWQTAAWRTAPKLLVQLELFYSDGHKDCILSDGSWEYTLDGSIRSNSIYAGETHDARFDLQKAVWKPACLTEAPKTELSAQLMEPIRRLNTCAPARITRLGDGAYVITAPEMMAGWAKLRLQIPRGCAVTVLYGETLENGGHVTRIGKGEGSCGGWWPESYIQCDTFIGNGMTAEYEPRYSYKGFRFLEISGYPGALTPADVTLYRIGNDIAASAALSCSEKRVMQLHDMMCRTLRNNFQGKPTDTPVWEKNGWLGDANVALNSMLVNYDMQAFFKEFIRTMDDCFRLYGELPVMVPTAAWYTSHSPLWNSVFVFGVKELYHRFGDRQLLETIYPELLRYTELNMQISEANGWLWRDHGLDDWVSPMGKADAPSCANSSEGSGIVVPAFVFQALQAMVSMARLLGKEQDAIRFDRAAQSIQRAFHKKFYRAEECLYDTGTWNDLDGCSKYRSRYRQTSNLIPLVFGMVPEAHRQAVFERLCQDVVEKDCHLDTGCIGTPFILPVLTDMGRADLAYKLLMQDSYPSWGYWLSKGADTMWESWDDQVRSLDHYFLGTCEEFFYSHIVGIQDIRDGWRSFTIRPCMTEYIHSAGATLDTVRGKVSCHWYWEDGKLHLEITVPFGAEATVRLPGTKADGCRLKSGHYCFAAEAPP